MEVLASPCGEAGLETQQKVRGPFPLHGNIRTNGELLCRFISAAMQGPRSESAGEKLSFILPPKT